MKIVKLFCDRAMGLFSIGVLYGLLLCLMTADMPVCNIAAWVVTGLFLLAFAVRLIVVLSCKDAKTLAVRDGGGDGFSFSAVVLLFAVEFYRTGKTDAALIALVVFVLVFLSAIFISARRK